MFVGGWYMYMNRTGHKKGAQARLGTPNIPPSTKTCFQFWYHMYGPDPGQLLVYMKSKNEFKGLWNKQGSFGPTWRHGLVEITSDSDFKVITISI